MIKKFLAIENDLFERWAFGKNWKMFRKTGILVPFSLCEEWNELHGDKLKIDPDENIFESLIKMRKIYEEHNADHNSDDTTTSSTISGFSDDTK